MNEKIIEGINWVEVEGMKQTDANWTKQLKIFFIA
jgi:hypothetical protein